MKRTLLLCLIVTLGAFAHAKSNREQTRFGGVDFEGWVELSVPGAVGALNEGLITVKPKPGRRFATHKGIMVTPELDKASPIIYHMLTTTENLATAALSFTPTAPGKVTVKGTVSLTVCQDEVCQPASAGFSATVDVR